MSRKRQSSGPAGGPAGDWLFTNDVVFRLVGRPQAAQAEQPATNAAEAKPGQADEKPGPAKRAPPKKRAPGKSDPKAPVKPTSSKPRRPKKTAAPVESTDPPAAFIEPVAPPVAQVRPADPPAKPVRPADPAAAPVEPVDPLAAPATAKVHPVASTAATVPIVLRRGETEAAETATPILPSARPVEASIEAAPPRDSSVVEPGQAGAFEPPSTAANDQEAEDNWPPRSGWFRMAAGISTGATIVLVVGIVWLALSFILRSPAEVGQEIEAANDDTAQISESSNAVASNDDAGRAAELPPVRVIGDPWPTSTSQGASSTSAVARSTVPAEAGDEGSQPLNVTAAEESSAEPSAGEVAEAADTFGAQPLGPPRSVQVNTPAASPQPAPAPESGIAETTAETPPPLSGQSPATSFENQLTIAPETAETPASDDRRELATQTLDPADALAEDEEQVFAPPVRQPLPRPAPPSEPEIAALETEPQSAEITETVLPGDGAGPRIVVHVPSSGRAAFSSRLSNALRSIGGQVEVREVGIDSRVSRVRYFYPDDRAAAQAIRRAVAASGGDWNVDLSDFTHYRPLPRPGTIEVWLSASR